MSHRRLEIWDQAEDELLDAASWYDLQREGLGDDLISEVQRTLDRILQAPLQHPEIRLAHRRAIVARFPYSVIYRAGDDLIEIIAIMHQSRRPDRWYRRRK